jgi:nicotinamidase/pyrazinamidase
LWVVFCAESTLDAGHLGLNSYVIVDGCRGIELQPGDIAHALEEMKDASTVLLKSSAL